jgi:hypothetical protein
VPVNIERLWEVAASVLIAVFVGAAKVFSVKTKMAADVRWVLGQLFVSGVAGLLVTLFARGALNLNSDLLGVAAGVAGWGGSTMIDSLYKKTAADLGLNIQKPDKPQRRPRGGAKAKAEEDQPHPPE